MTHSTYPLYLHHSELTQGIGWVILHVTSFIMCVWFSVLGLTGAIDATTLHILGGLLGGLTTLLFIKSWLYNLSLWLSGRPVITFTHTGILLDAGLFDRHFIPWPHIEAFSTSLTRPAGFSSELHEPLDLPTGFTTMDILTAHTPRRVSSAVIHPTRQNTFEVCYNIKLPEGAALVDLQRFINAHAPSPPRYDDAGASKK